MMFLTSVVILYDLGTFCENGIYNGSDAQLDHPNLPYYA